MSLFSFWQLFVYQVKILKFLDQKNRESVPPFKRALRLFMVRDVAGGCSQLRDSFVLLLVSG